MRNEKFHISYEEHTISFQNSVDFISRDRFHSTNSMGITENHTNLRWSETTLGQLADVQIDLVGGSFEPNWGSSPVWDSTGADTFSITVLSTHGWSLP
jgi:hypothetical protein